MNERELLEKRFLELANRSYNSGIYQFTDFLGLAELSVFEEMRSALRGIPYTMFGGAAGAERVMIRFGDEESLGYEQPFPIAIIKAEPVSPKFAEKLTHRDFLGAILNLGIERSTVGDIIVRESTAYFFLKEDISDYIISGLTRARHTDLKVRIADLIPEGELYKTERKRIQASGERIDAVIAKVFSLSRSDSSLLFSKKLVFINGKLCENDSQRPRENDVVSVRGHGRFIYLGYDTTTRKGKLNIDVELYV